LARSFGRRLLFVSVLTPSRVSWFPQFATLGVSARAQLAWLHLAAMLGPALATLTESGMRPETTRER